MAARVTGLHCAAVAGRVAGDQGATSMRLHFLALAVAGAAVAQGPTFAAPVRVKAGDKLMGENRLYPSPVFHDLDGDKLADIVIGDLRGLMTFALRKPGTPITYGDEQKLVDAAGKDIDFHNW
jgi:hypothetical protein